MYTTRLVSLIRSRGLYSPTGRYDAVPSYGKIFYGSGYPITGVIKFLGYYDSTFNIANFPSISINTDFSEAYSAVMLTEDAGNDSVIFDGVEDEGVKRRAIKALHVFRNIYSVRGSFHLYVSMKRKYDNAKGLGESASMAAAAARSIARAVFGEESIGDGPFVSKIARLASGSGSKSVNGPLSLWISDSGYSHDSSFSLNLPFNGNKISICAIPLSGNMSTEDAHSAALRSPFYNAWASYQRQAVLDFLNMEFDADTIMRTALGSTLKMHSILMSSASLVWTDRTMKIVKNIMDFRLRGNSVSLSIDTGPSVVIIAESDSELKEISDAIGEICIEGKLAEGEPKIPLEFMERAKESLTKYA
ncbi:hypothetical protein DMB44_02335 [Thermoplasma sp. Kam2015]|uniref:hypothetical protein n=1 Tax=Thermoplasma sp. Kam2015 TaxID=2094122 RepID=UPI000D877C9C|nr:hypothetical protein [Thermoplasma sp. Kam2015]PYB68731.1 hypothetical protein DMB44_02335 [Thermoplasma sp. Kam2015]